MGQFVPLSTMGRGIVTGPPGVIHDHKSISGSEQTRIHLKRYLIFGNAIDGAIPENIADMNIPSNLSQDIGGGH